jgi:integrase
MARTRLTDSLVKSATCEPGRDREIHWDSGLGGFGLMVTEQGHKSWVYQYRNRAGESRRITIKGAPNAKELLTVLSLDKARKEARGYIGEVVRGGDPAAARRAKKSHSVTTLKTVAEDYLRRQPHRSTGPWRANLERLVYPVLGNRPIDAFNGKRGPLIALIDDIKAERGPGMAKVVRTNLSAIFNWYAGRVDGFSNPLVRGVAAPDKYQPRDRTLSDAEIVQVWKAAESFASPWGHYVRFLLLTACRKSEAADMTWAELDGDTWVIPAERSKSKTSVALPLSTAARNVLASLPRFADCPFVFTITGKAAIAGFSRFKTQFDAACGVLDWTIHDLRRTARSLLSRAGVSPDTSERCLGHKLTGVRAVYDHHRYLGEMLHGFEALSAQIDRIVNPPADVVTPLRGRKP